MAPENEGGRVEARGEALVEILHVDVRICGRAIRDEVERLGGRLVKDVKVAFLYEERAGDLAAMGTKKKKRVGVCELDGQRE